MGKPRLNCKLGSRPNGWELGAYRDKLGNVSFMFWKSGEGFDDEVKVNPRDVKKLRDWLSKVIAYTERPNSHEVTR